MADLEDRIEEVAGQPAEARDDEGSMKNPDLAGLVVADKHLRRTAAAARSGLPIRMGKFRPPAAV